MIVIKIEMWPKGIQKRSYMLGKIIITNDGTGNSEYGNYKGEIKHGGKYYGKLGNYRIGKVFKFNKSLSPYHLLAKTLKSCNIK